MSLGRYSMIVLGVVLTTLALAWPVVLQRLEGPARSAIALGALIAILNTIAAYALVRWASGRPLPTFLRAVLGGMAVRMALMTGAVVAGFLVLGLPRLPLAASLLSYFVLFLAMELLVTQRQSGSPAGAPR